MCDGIEMAKHVVAVSQKKGIPVDNLILQRVLKEIHDTVPESSVAHFPDASLDFGFGPYYPNVYRFFSFNSGNPITQEIEDPLASCLSEEDERKVDEAIDRWTA